MSGKIKRLTFLLRENVPSWPPEFVDFDRSKVTEFRKKLRAERSIEEFSSIPELAAFVRRAVEREFGVLPSRFGLLPYLIDRTEQLKTVNSELENRKLEATKRPFFFLVQGEDVQCPDKFVEQALVEKVAPFAEVPPEEKPFKVIFVRWPVDADDVAAEFLNALGEKLLIRGASRDQIRDALQNHPCIPAIHSRILTSDWKNGRTEAQIEAFRKLWSEWKDLVSRRPIIIFLELKYESRETSLLNIFSSYSRLNKHIRNFLAFLAKGAKLPSEPGVTFRVLDELFPVRRSDVENWVDENEEVKQICGDHDLRPHIKKMYSLPEARKYAARLTMHTVSSELQKLLSTGCVCMNK